MNRRELGLFFLLELLAIVVAGGAFTLIHSKLIAGGVAGGYFVLSGAYMLWLAQRWLNRWSSATWYVLWVHVALVALPMLVVRFTHMNMEFDQITIWGLSGNRFHRLSTVVFSILMAATLLDFSRARPRIEKD